MARVRITGELNKDIQFDKAKFVELVLYVADKCSEDPDFGATKLNKILFYSDFQSYGLFGSPVTGAPYFGLRHGPAPKPWLPIRKEMKANGDIAIQVKKHFNWEQQRVIPLREADLSRFSARDIALVDAVIQTLCGCNADEVSRLSHMEVGWQIAEIQEDIPYESVFLSDEPLTADEVKHGLELASTHGWSI